MKELNISFVPNSPGKERHYDIRMDDKIVGSCDREVVDEFIALSSDDKITIEKLENSLKFDTYESIHKELDTLKWIGEDVGWELAIAAVQRMLLKKGEELV